MKPVLTTLLLVIANLLHAQSVTTKTILWSEKVKDSFELYVSLPKHAAKNETYSVVYYCDANLKSGRALRALLADAANDEKTAHTFFAGVGHIGNFHVLRGRDMILPSIKGADTTGRSADYGQTEKFYQFLKTELIPKINSAYKTNTNNNTILGHSLGGLFAFYCLYKNETVFKNYYALSPTLWIDKYSIYDFNKLTIHNMPARTLHFSSGGGETMNHILKGTNDMDRFLKEKKYNGLNFVYKVYPGKTQNSAVEGELKDMRGNLQ